MKKIIILLAVSMLVVVMIGCSSKSGVSIGEVGTITENTISKKYESSSQTFTKEFSFKDGETATAKVKVVTESGKIKMDIVNDQGVSIYTGNQMPTCEFSAKADKSGKYTLTVTTNKHKGSFEVVWVVNK